ncbi:MAG TPA: hypothetical protein PLL69_06065, partial [Gemmatimonadales bacterium]|nr:hypothetical protein [Gemmatimonadales bacterium]
MLALALLATLQVADTVRYDLSFPHATQHEAEVVVTFPARRRDTLDIRMSRSSPGRYALHEFAKNVFAVRATDGAGRDLPRRAGGGRHGGGGQRRQADRHRKG